MTRKAWKTIKDPNMTSEIHIIGNGHIKETFYARPDWNDDPDDPDGEEEAFRYRGNVYFLSEFMRVEKYAPKWIQEFDGYMNDTYFSGILVKYAETDCGDTSIKVYSFYS